MSQPKTTKAQKIMTHLLSFLGALGGALQNYSAVELFLRGITGGAATVSKLLSGGIQTLSVVGGACNGMINYFINVELVEGFFQRITNNKSLELSGWRKFRYYAGIFVFGLSGVLFGATAFAFSAATPIAIAALAAGVFVAIIMTIQEVETWLQSFDEASESLSLKEIAKHWWNTLTYKKLTGHIIAAGNVLALSLVFTIALVDVLMAIEIPAFPALIIGISLAFTVGAFTEFYFYNFFLAKFCSKIEEKWEQMKAAKYSPLGFICITINALVNAALTYAGVGLLSGAFVSAGLGIPPEGLMMGLAIVSAVFSGSASIILGMDFWIRKLSPKPAEVVVEKAPEENGTASNPAILEEPKPWTPGLNFFEGPQPPVVPGSYQSSLVNG